MKSSRALTEKQVRELMKTPGNCFYTVDSQDVYTLKIIDKNNFIYTWHPGTHNTPDSNPDHRVHTSIISKWLANGDNFFDNYWFALAHFQQIRIPKNDNCNGERK